MERILITADAVDGAEDHAVYTSWLGAVHASARIAAISIVDGSVRSPGPGRNYYRVMALRQDGMSLRILLNAPARLVAASRDAGVPSNGPLDFSDVPGPEAYRRAGLLVPNHELLRAPFAAEDVLKLTDTQTRDVEYHRPEAVGDLLFNWFD